MSANAPSAHLIAVERFTELLNELAESFEAPEELNTAIHQRMSDKEVRALSEFDRLNICQHELLRRQTFQRIGKVAPLLVAMRTESAYPRRERSKVRYSERKLYEALIAASTPEEVRAAIIAVPRDFLIPVPDVGLLHAHEITREQWRSLIVYHQAKIDGHRETIVCYETFDATIEKYHVATLGEIAYPTLEDEAGDI